MANAESEGDFILEYIENFPLTKTCIKYIEDALKKHATSSSTKSQGEFILDFVKGKPSTLKCQQYIQDARTMWKGMRGNNGPSQKTNQEELAEIFAPKPAALSKSELQIVKNLERLELGLNENSAKNFVLGARNLPPAGSAIRPHKPNIFPSADLTTLHSLEGLNAFIELNYRLGEESRMTTPTSRTVGAVITNYKRYSFSKYQIMFSSGNNSDCLIHTFLTATCPAFRRLAQADKNAFATWVRLYVLPASPVLQRKFADDSPDDGELGGKTVGEEARLRFFTAGEFLADIDIGQIAMIYQVNILTFEKQAGQQTVRLSIGSSAALQPNTPVYMFMNASGAHFESVRTDTGSYTIPLSLAYDILTIITEDTVKEAVERMSEASSVRTTARDFQIRLGNVGTANNLRRELDEKIQEAKRRLSGGGHRRQTRRRGIRSKRHTRKA